MRLFVAVDLPAPISDGLGRAVDLLRQAVTGARWTKPSGRHLTLKFLGEVADARVPDVESAIEDALAGAGSFEAALGGVGGFPNLKRPRVLWVGVAAGVDGLADLAGRLDTALEPLGFAVEKRPYSAHLTLARFKDPAPVGTLPAVDVPAEPFTVEDAVLYRSKLRPSGAEYTALRRVQL